MRRRISTLTALASLALVVGGLLAPPPALAATPHRLHVGQSIGVGERLVSRNGLHALVLRRNGSLERVDHRTVTWSSGTQVSASAAIGSRLRFTASGRLLLVRKSGHVAWGSRRIAGAQTLGITDGGRVEVHAGSRAVLVGAVTPVAPALAAVAPQPSASAVTAPSADPAPVSTPDSTPTPTPTPTPTASDAASGPEPTAAPAPVQSDAPAASASTASTTSTTPSPAVSAAPAAPAAAAAPSAPTISDRLTPDQRLQPGQTIRSNNGLYTLAMQTDGNLVLYGPSGALWATNRQTGNGTWAVMQTDGNLVVYKPAGGAAWASGTGTAGSSVVVQDDGNLVVYTPAGRAAWSSNTAQSTAPAAAASNPVTTWAIAQLGQTRASTADAAGFTAADWGTPYGEWSGDCAKFVIAAWRHAGHEIAHGDAVTIYRTYAGQGRVQGGAAPAGALVFYPTVTQWGHVAISDGAGGVYTTQGTDGANKPIAHLAASYFGTPAGWTMPFPL